MIIDRFGHNGKHLLYIRGANDTRGTDKLIDRK